MRLYSALFLFSAFALAIVNFLSPLSAQPLPTIKPGTLLSVEVRRADGSYEHGTGFLAFGDGKIATAYHVVQGAVAIELFDGQTRFLGANVFAVYPEADLALLHHPDLAERVPYPTLRHTPDGLPGDPIAVHGNPIGLLSKELWGRRIQIGLEQAGLLRLPSPKTGKMTDVFSDPKFHFLPMDINVQNGMSGGPVINGQGDVIAVLSGSLSTGGDLAWAIPVERFFDRDRWQELRRLPNQVAWPDQVLVSPDFDYGRSRAVFETDRVAAACRSVGDQFAAGVATLEHHAADFLSFMRTRKPTLVRAMGALNSDADLTQIAEETYWMVDEAGRIAKALAGAEQELRQLSRDLERRCGTELAHHTGWETLPATRKNILRTHDLLRTGTGRMLAPEAERELREQIDRRNAELSAVFSETRLEQQTAQADGLTQKEGIQLNVRMLRDIEGFASLSAQDGLKSSYFRSILENARAGADLADALSLDPLETEDQSHEVTLSGMSVTLHDGWLELDETLLGAIGPATERRFFSKWQAVNLGDLKDRVVKYAARIAPHDPLLSSSKGDSLLGRIEYIDSARLMARLSNAAWLLEYTQNPNAGRPTEFELSEGEQQIFGIAIPLGQGRTMRLLKVDPVRNLAAEVRCHTGRFPTGLLEACATFASGTTLE